MRQLIIIFSVIIQSIALQSQWISNYSGHGLIDVNIENARGTAIISDISDNCYVTGYSTGNNTGADIITIKYDPNGDTLWVRYYNGNADLNDEGSAITLDHNGNIYVAGYASDVYTSNNMVVLKYSSTGELLWVNTYYVYGHFADDKASDVAVDNNDNVIVTGYGTTESGNTVLLTRKLSGNGTEIWTNAETSFTGNSQAVKLAVNNTDDVYITGYVSAGSSADMVLIKYNENGGKIFQQVIGGEGEDKAWGIAVDDDEDCVIISGNFTNPAGNSDCYTAKFNSTGNILWYNLYNGTGNSEDKAWGIAVDDDEDAIYINGSTTDFYANVNYITIKYNSSGNQVWAAEYNGTGNGRDQANAIGLIYQNGTVSEVVSAGESIGINNNFDYATIRYNAATGEEISASRYSLSSNTDDKPLDIAISISNGRIYLTGFSQYIAENRFNNSSSLISSLMYTNGNNLKYPGENNIPGSFELMQNYPNPFNPSTNIQFSIPVNSWVRLSVYDVSGKEIDVLLNAQMQPGNYSFTYNCTNLSSGVYLYVLKAGSFTGVKKMIFLK